MPLINVFTSMPAPEADRAEVLLLRLSETLARELKKPESYVMTCLNPGLWMTFGGTTLPACYAEVKNIGHLSADTTARLSKILCTELSEALGVELDRVYIEFTNLEPHLFGFKGETFA